MDDVKHETSEEQRSRRKRKSLEKGRLRENTILDNQADEMTYLPFRSWCRHLRQGKGRREEDCLEATEDERLHVHGRRRGTTLAMARSCKLAVCGLPEGGK